MMLRTGRDYVGRAFVPHMFAGVGDLGAMTREEAIKALVAGAGPESEAFKTYYGSGGYYEKSESVQRAETESTEGGVGPAPPSSMLAPMLYPSRECGPTDGACIAYNQQVQIANMAIMENARRAFNLQVCEYNAALNPRAPQPCGQYRERVPEPTVPNAVKQTAVCSGGECYTPIAGSGAPATEAQATFRQQYTPTGVRKPNQTVPPSPQPGEVPTSPVPRGGGGTTGTIGPGLPFGMSANTFLIAGAVLLAVFAMKGKG